MLEQVYTVNMAADYISRSRCFVRESIKLKKFKTARKIGERWLIEEEELKAFNKTPFQNSRKEVSIFRGNK